MRYKPKAAVLKAIAAERQHQLDKFGLLDQYNSIGDFLIYMQRYVRFAMNTYNDPRNAPEALDAIRKVTALGVAAMEKHGVVERGK